MTAIPRSGPAAPLRPTPLRPLRLDEVELSPESQLGRWQQLNRSATIPHCVTNLESSGVLDNFRRLLGESDKPFTGFWFADSDLGKTLEAVGWETGRSGDPSWKSFLDTAADLMERAQADDGYLDSYVQGTPDAVRWDNLKWSHEMYVAGHLIQAAVAVHRGSGDDRLLAIARRVADLLVATFGEGARDLYDGHPEVETALVELYRETGHEPYLQLAKRQIDLRGQGLLGEDRFGPQYFQDHAPVRETTEAIGHSVRHLYLAAGATDVAVETGDTELLEVMKKLWHSAFATKVYVTGAHGSRHRDEAYGDPYELPPDRAYAETCASIAAFQWGWRMLLATGDAQYAEEMERALYNAIAASTSQSGTEFFYSNPLQLRTGHDGSTEDSPDQRLSWYACACCPPNLARLVASLQAYVATTSEAGVQLQLLTAGAVRTTAPDGSPVELRVSGGYPWDGELGIEVSGGTAPWELAVRIPAWASEVQVAVDGTPVEEAVGSDSYLRITRDWSAGARVSLVLPMQVRAIAPHPRVDAVRGCLALARGPVVYCLEQADHDAVVEDIRLVPGELPQPRDVDGPDVVLTGSGVAVAPEVDELYVPGAAPRTTSPQPVDITAIPYYRWANRGPNAMRVWIPTTEKAV
ncbi:hypothetical protein CLV35_2394 [Motilibacter peucedani]|uniref:Glycoside hydrolase family 127 protein n=1 Tax=Motilibacter peucedani TaxID=598650 RepID=A0A420XNX0_9ACTN|nr:beta-L-arabinofuranosidase domain-containing protein [Motilibacter peucedani]RKS73900.1 hypothetical protein CLV35_2394 [Motilibacter peucedani]